MKKGKLNSSGFVLVETLIVTVFVMTIFAVLYNNFTPIMGEYEKREFYDYIDGKYAAYWIKRIIENSNVSFRDGVVDNKLKAIKYKSDPSDPNKTIVDECGGNGYLIFKCDGTGDFVVNSPVSDICQQLFSRMNVENVYMTRYKLSDFKTKLSDGCTHSSGNVILSGFSGGMHRYVGYLPDFKVDSLNGAKYRVIVEFERRDGAGGTYMAYSTFEVIK